MKEKLTYLHYCGLLASYAFYQLIHWLVGRERQKFEYSIIQFFDMHTLHILISLFSIPVFCLHLFSFFFRSLEDSKNDKPEKHSLTVQHDNLAVLVFEFPSA